ncbi:copper resistance protein CopC [Rheinheimera marina]|uniref:Copper resistance protein CopC n=1 Tax=Rheinheimera marina TaxID=1774958 RepID=A0ABV9JRX2_9GAMM
MKKLIPLLTLLCLAFAGPVLAHVKQSGSVPADNAMLMKAPDVLSISFSGPIRLTKVTLLHDNGNTVDFGFTPTAVATQFSWPLPVLEIGSYQVNWVGLGEDVHKMKGDFSFMLHAGADAGVKADSAHAHQH